MIALKYFENFSESENEKNIPSLKDYNDNNPDPESWNYNAEDNSFNFEFYGDQTNPYSVKVFPEIELFLVRFPDGGFQYCAWSALKNNAGLFKEYEDGIFYKWLLRVIMNVEFSVICMANSMGSPSLVKSIFGKQE
jgi:hypothetical protein